ncbi:translation initiation factor IF-2 [Candidatus Jorgensenbacteria bacterium RIFCSPLOWO2_01_FULL_45_25b]|uniref:Translation initiation factor IF-2 n=1 Tax=Candidatus Jorgensenbacteria bacterium RIFCSPLOWO2_01_FULL_45_25b TaxID=1798471 RepID=A0A1F6BVJ6_9BACT|nr:MAG: translation initiation factor IF-2 [Candidatus Jorgensenbacteria bacterium RIFCSPLOWO2_01_FULL_45_25b]
MLKKRPPIIAVMGHVDHGKTTLLDAIRKTDVATREAGGITQAIGAYEITHGSQPITFIDTPGHEAFKAMRACGAEGADLAILVVASDDGVKPQTKEAIECVNKAKTPFIVAINKTDLPGADIEKTKNDLAQNDVYLEGYGGNVSWHAISAKTGEGINELLDLVVLATDLEELTCDNEACSEGIVLRSMRDSRRGVVVSGIIKNGALKIGLAIATQTAKGKIKILENTAGDQVSELAPSAPFLILGFEDLPKVGETFYAGENEKEIQEKAAHSAESKETRNQTSQGNPNDSLKVILKADEYASLEALKGIMEKTKTRDAKIYIADASVGNITENDIKNAGSVNAMIVGFKTKVDKAAENLARVQKVELFVSNIIYELEKTTKAHLEKNYRKPTGILEVLKVFGERNERGQIIGGKVTEGIIKNKSTFEITKDGELVGNGKIINLQTEKQNAGEVGTEKECGMLVECDSPIQPGNKLFFFE